MKRGSYFFKRNWMEHYQLIIQGEARRPAFHFFVDNKAGQLTFECACRFERERAEQANLIIPHHVDVLFPAGAEVDISHIAIDFPNGFQVNNYDQQLDEAIWTGIVHQFLNQPVVHDFLSVNVH
jgi:hypothetical protein